MVYKDEQTTDRTEINYINTLKSWLKNIFNYNKKFVDDVNLNWIVNNQNEVLFKILEFRNENKQSIETLRKDINTILKILKLCIDDETNEMIKKYKIINFELSQIYQFNDKKNELNEREQKAFITHNELLKLRAILYETWETEFNETALTKYKNPKLRIKNITSLLLSFYTLFPPARLEPMNLEIVTTEKEAKTKQAALLIKDKKNIIIYYSDVKKQHKPIQFNINDPEIIKFSQKEVENLMDNVNESLKLYARTFLFINSNGKPYTEKGLQKILYELLPDKNLGVSALRSSYITHYYKKLNKLGLERVAYLMRTSIKTISDAYNKKVDLDYVW